MKRLLTYVVLAAGVSLLSFGCSNKNSQEACQHETTHNLDKGNFDAVLASGCAGDMQKGAAYLGKAGFTMHSVVNSFLDRGATSSGTTTDKGDLTAYMGTLVGQVNSDKIANLDKSQQLFEQVCNNTSPTEPLWKDANFNESLVNTVKSLSLLKTVIDSSGTGSVSACDLNGNGVPDASDATACALYASSNLSCAKNGVPFATYALQAPDITLYDKTQNPIDGTYSGLIITVTGTPTAECLSTFKRLLYKATDGAHWVATTVDTCYDSAGQEWPCPLAGDNVDLVKTLDHSLSDAQASLTNATPDAKGNDAINAIQKIRKDACPDPVTGCTNASIANYLQTMKK